MMNNKPTMTSREAAALYLSKGATDDVETAEMIDSGQILDPDLLTRSHFRRMMGFDFTLLQDEKTNKWIVRDDELHLEVRTPLSDDATVNATRISRACLKLKQKHDKRLAEEIDV